MIGPPFALGLFEGGNAVVGWLAVVGGAALGALLIPWLFGLVVRLYTTKNLPALGKSLLRVLGGLACGVAVYVFVFGGGGTGFGGLGLLGVGSGPGSGTTTPSSTARNGTGRSSTTKSDKEAVKENGVNQENTLVVEVLGDDALRKITRSDTFDPNDRYRIRGSSDRLSLENVKKMIVGRQKKGPNIRRVQIVIYLDSPAPDKPQVRDLAAWAREQMVNDEKMMVELREPDRYAPVD
jgi:hypothetical protein